MTAVSAPELAADRSRTVTIQDLVPGEGVSLTDAGRWSVTIPHIRCIAKTPLEPGWYEVRLSVQSADKFTVRKRLELTFDAAESNTRPVGREAFAWNRGFEEVFMIRLGRVVAGVRLDIWHAEGEIELRDFQIHRISQPAVLARAVRTKVRLTRAYHCFGRAAMRGGRLLLKGRFKEFGSKLLKGLTDARVMQLGSLVDVDVAWSRRHALPAEEAEQIRQAVDQMSDPAPLAILLPVDPNKMDIARLSALSVRRQIYPHWQLLVAAAGPAGFETQLENIIGPDPRVIVGRVPRWSGISSAVASVLGKTDCEQVVVLPPGLELAEHALYHFAARLKEEGVKNSLAAKVSGGPELVWMKSVRELTDNFPEVFDAKALADWSLVNTPKEKQEVLEPILAYPPDERPILDRSRVDEPGNQHTTELCLAADVRGVGGWDHVAFAVLKGLPSAGADLRMHPTAAVRTDLVPASLIRPVGEREFGDPQVVIGPPFLIARFGLDRSSVVYTMWEIDRLDPDWIPWLNRVRLVVVPSQWQVECFRACGVTTPMAVAPLGFDPLIFHPCGSFPEVCTFGTAGALTAGGIRKNAQWIVDLFRQAFPKQKDVQLRVKISPGSPSVETYDDDRVDVIRAVLPPFELADWYRSLTTYVNGSAGEGFGLHLIEAMACGRPLISPCYSGLTAYFDSSVGYTVEHRMVPVRNEIYAGNWAEPDEKSMIAQMQRVYRNRAEAMKFGSASAARAKLFTWKAGGRALAQALREHGLLD